MFAYNGLNTVLSGQGAHQHLFLLAVGTIATCQKWSIMASFSHQYRRNGKGTLLTTTVYTEGNIPFIVLEGLETSLKSRTLSVQLRTVLGSMKFIHFQLLILPPE